MKLLITAIIGILLCSHASAKVISFRVDGHGTNRTYRISDRQVSPGELSALLTKLHGIDADQTLFVYCNDTNAVSDVVPLLMLIKKSGLTKVLIACPSMRANKPGTQFITLNLNDPPDFAPSCTGDIPLDDGFLADTDSELEEITPEDTQELERLFREDQERNAQPAGGAYVAPEAGAPSAHP